ncbi:uncharacterized protein G2W53_001251 [Senna tora]|uniref:Uncharacterized protein n=1 Tax=Senna tora TaxID=362788 RepID=A0A835CIF5_9FABA|nr:uncharacterized protein G2W53_001251 [Senna tora]
MEISDVKNPVKSILTRVESKDTYLKRDDDATEARWQRCGDDARSATCVGDRESFEKRRQSGRRRRPLWLGLRDRKPWKGKSGKRESRRRRV